MLWTLCGLRENRRLGGDGSGTGSVSEGYIYLSRHCMPIYVTGSSSHCCSCVERNGTLGVEMNGDNAYSEECLFNPVSRHARR